MNKINHHDKIHGAIFGLLIGDAVGVSYEFKQSSQIKNIDMFPDDLINKTYPDIAYGTWSDDGSQTLILLESLIENQKFNMDDFLQRLSKWLFDGYMALDNNTFDVGIQTYKYIQSYKTNKKFKVNKSPDESENGNGSLMRCLPLALWHTGEDQELVELAHQQSLATHPHIRSQVCCALYCLIARKLLSNFSIDQAIKVSIQELTRIYLDTSNEQAITELENHIVSYDTNSCNGTGYVVDSLMTALLCLKENTYEAVIKKAISFGNDTDTTACIAGGLAGIMFGFNAIPNRWVIGLSGKNMVYPLLDKLLNA